MWEHPETTRHRLFCEKLDTIHDVKGFAIWVYCCWKCKWWPLLEKRWSDQCKADWFIAKFALKITTKSAIFYRLLFGEVCLENSREITAKLADFSVNLSQKTPRIWLFFCDLSEALMKFVLLLQESLRELRIFSCCVWLPILPNLIFGWVVIHRQRS